MWVYLSTPNFVRVNAFILLKKNNKYIYIYIYIYKIIIIIIIIIIINNNKIK